MPTIGELEALLRQMAPYEAKLDFDNVGLLLGLRCWETDTVLLSLDITDEVVEEAQELGAGLVLSHHPLFFDLKAASDRTPEGARAARLLSSRIAAICLHTNLDAADGGVNDALAAALGVNEAVPFEPEHIARIGRLAGPKELRTFLADVKTALGCNGLRYVDGGRAVSCVAVGGGSCGDMLEAAAAAGCDTFVTADVKYNAFLRAKELRVNLIDAGHFNTENVVIPVLAAALRKEWPELRIHISNHGQTEQFFC